jgi:hypothetical protein
MIAAMRTAGALGLAVVIGLVSACDDFLLNEPGTITIRNFSNTETAVIAVIADDVKSYPTLGPNRNAVITTATGGNYQVLVVMSSIDAQNYRNNLEVLRQNVMKIVDGTASNDEKVRFFGHLAEINSAIAQAQPFGASCSGKINLSEDQAEGVSVEVNWIPTLGSGSWSLACGSK